MRKPSPMRLVLAALLVLLGSCGISEEVYNRDVNALKVQIEGLQAAQATLESDLAKTEADKARCLGELTALVQQKGELSGDLNSALEQLERMREVAARQKAMLDGLVESLASMTQAGKIKVVRRNGRLIVEIAENILFDSGKSRLKAEGVAALTELAPLLAHVEREFQVTGHTDNVGTEAYNWRLSLDRALSVLQQMTDAGYPSKRLSAAGYAWFQPVATNDTPEGRQLNRRVEIVLVPNLDELKLPEVASCRSWMARAELPMLSSR
ncbi:MAG: OmpA family protein [Deltaproteobacteria bacterium]|nr:OmpA family protein [Deltaproteobacteria bacterium]